MIVYLAGCNIETHRIPEVEDATPEVISAAYARISRSKKRVDHLRAEARKEVDAARRSNTRIVFGMGHASVAEHAVFNFDIIGVSRYLTEFIQKSRLASFTEKSQRYVTLHGDYVVPPEITGSPMESRFRELIGIQNELYKKLGEQGIALFMAAGSTPEEAAEHAKEDARYVLSLSTETQMGATFNARSLERLLRRLGKLPLLEASLLRDQMHDLVSEIAPSLIRYTDPEPYDRNRLDLAGPEPAPWIGDARLLACTPDIDDRLLSLALCEENGLDPVAALELVHTWSPAQKADAYQTMLQDMTPYHAAPEVFEFAEFQFALRMSSCCFAQIKRHRLASRFRTSRRPDYRVVLPEWFARTDLMPDIECMLAKTAELWEDFEDIQPGLGDYALTNAHVVQVVMKMNLRELYHFCRLRCDHHAQWEIRRLATVMRELVVQQAPLAAAQIMGKDEFSESLK